MTRRKRARTSRERRKVRATPIRRGRSSREPGTISRQANVQEVHAIERLTAATPLLAAITPLTPDVKITERFTRTAEDTIEFEMKIDDPDVLSTGSMTIKYPMQLDNDYIAYEYSCHEGNTAVRYYIETSRFERGVGPSAEEREAARNQ